MRVYLSPAKRVIERALPHPDATRLFLSKHRALLFIVTASVVVIMTLGFMTMRVMGVFDPSTRTVTADGKTSTLTTTTNTTPDTAAGQPSTIVNQQTTSQSSSSNAKPETNTSVTVNNQPIDLPANGTTHKTVKNSDGSTTDVTVTTNSQSNDNGSSSTSVTTNTNTNTMQSLNTSSNSMSIERTSQ